MRGWGPALVAALALAVPARAARAADEIRTLSAAQAVDLALAHNPALQAQRQGVASARASEVTAGLRPNPTFFNETQDFTGALVWPLERGGKRRRRIDSARLATAIAGTDYLDARRGLVLAVRQAYTQILLAGSNLALADANLKDFSEVERLNQVRFDKGAISGADLDRIQLQRLQFETDVQDASLALATARASLRALVATPELAPEFEATDELKYTDFDRPLAELLDLALRSRPDLRSAETAREKARADVRLAEANAVTDVSVTAGWSHAGPTFEARGSSRFQPFFPAGATSNAFGTGLSFPLRIFDRNQGEIARTRSEVARADELARAVRNQVINDVEVAYRTVAGSGSRVGLYERTFLAKSREAREIAELAFKKGATSILDLLEAERTDRSVQLAYRQALASYLLARSVLDAAVMKDVAP
jgi:cobalt-zinc-cadmium efflux system outer membrane protein